MTILWLWCQILLPDDLVISQSLREGIILIGDVRIPPLRVQNHTLPALFLPYRMAHRLQAMKLLLYSF